jgi:hypothetical protein
MAKNDARTQNTQKNVTKSNTSNTTATKPTQNAKPSTGSKQK